MSKGIELADELHLAAAEFDGAAHSLAEDVLAGRGPYPTLVEEYRQARERYTAAALALNAYVARGEVC